MTEFKDGDIVRIVIERARVTNSFTTGRRPVGGPDVDTGTVLVFRCFGEDIDDKAHTVNLKGEGVTVEHIAPAEWPPQVDDLWRDRRGVVWFCMENHLGTVLLTDRSGGRHGTEYVTGQYGPLAFVHREQQDSGEPGE